MMDPDKISSKADSIRKKNKRRESNPRKEFNPVDLLSFPRVTKWLNKVMPDVGKLAPVYGVSLAALVFFGMAYFDNNQAWQLYGLIISAIVFVVLFVIAVIRHNIKTK